MANDRRNRAFGNLPKYSEGRLQRDGDRSSAAERQFAETGEFMPDGGNSSGRTMRGVSPYFVDNFQGRSGTPDNQSINRGKGTT
jgi:hypothetical protein